MANNSAEQAQQVLETQQPQQPANLPAPAPQQPHQQPANVWTPEHRLQLLVEQIIKNSSEIIAQL
ncbi:hypothetical protein BDBG_17648 [Blastomyces gilchristii SLH14081]|uniref:Uncharacterized protein n=1 Tax=Blastomyces gilchristii (strain SLH14081) TaxID=559298 RepID=A0A179UW60_BLAGS|nr:uncharacterized protein BDBG_17648 [Blastomyces gilchristii SLH14081]OAT12284.1 hypothetical protein BDBG_17648 [Blastomyces gilchristii SLH14081]